MLYLSIEDHDFVTDILRRHRVSEEEVVDLFAPVWAQLTWMRVKINL